MKPILQGPSACQVYEADTTFSSALSTSVRACLDPRTGLPRVVDIGYPPSFGLTVRALSVFHWFLIRRRKQINLHPGEPRYVRSRTQVQSYLLTSESSLKELYLRLRDFFTHAFTVGLKEMATAFDQIQLTRKRSYSL